MAKSKTKHTTKISKSTNHSLDLFLAEVFFIYDIVTAKVTICQPPIWRTFFFKDMSYQMEKYLE